MHHIRYKVVDQAWNQAWSHVKGHIEGRVVELIWLGAKDPIWERVDRQVRRQIRFQVELEIKDHPEK